MILAVAPLQLIDWLSLVALYLIWGSTYYALRIAVESMPPFLMAGMRFLVAGALLYGWLRLRGAPRPTARQWWAAAKVGILLLTISNGAVTFSEQWIGSGLAAVVVATMPLWTAVFGRLIGQRPSSREWAGLFVGFAGVAVLGAVGDLRAHTLGAVAIGIAPVAWALGSVWSRRLPLPEGAMSTAAQMLTGGVAMLAVGLGTGERLTQWPSVRSAGAWLYLVVFGSLVGFSAYVHLLRRVRPTLATSYAYVNPLIALVLGIVLGGEKIAPLTWVAAVVILSGVVLITQKPPTKLDGRAATHGEEKQRQQENEAAAGG